MHNTIRSLAIAATAAAFQIALSSHAAAQTGPVAGDKPIVQSLGDFGLVVSDLDRALAFYRDTVGLKVVGGPTKAVIDQTHNTLVGTAGARVRTVRLAVPNEPFGLRLEEYTGVPRTRVDANHNDPGSSFLNFGVLDFDRVGNALRKANPTVISPAGIPAAGQTSGGFRMVWLRDPDGHVLEIMQGGWDAENKPVVSVDNVYRAHFGMTMSDYRQALSFYKDLLGFDLVAGMGAMAPAGEYRTVGRMGSGLGIPAEAKMAAVSGHCARARCEMFAFIDAPRKDFRPHFQDPGASYLSVWVNGLDALVAKAKAAGLEIVTTTAEPVAVAISDRLFLQGAGTSAPLPVHHSRQIALRDPSGFLIILAERID